MSSSLDSYFDELRRLINDALGALFPSDASPPIVFDAMRYALLGGGKRLRPCLALAAADAVASSRAEPVGQARQAALPNACAVELVHSYSLVHDDLPAMDNDTLRRGRPTTHVVYGDGLAILAGDGLLTEAFGIVASPPRQLAASPPTAEVRMRSIAVLATAAGAEGMVGGQAVDLHAAGQVAEQGERKPPTRLNYEQLKDMHARKTGALIRAAVALGALAANANDATIHAIDEYGRELGLAFQIIDDVLDVDGTAGELGKTAGKDAAAQKVTYPSLFGVQQSRVLAAESVDRAKAALAAGSIQGRLAEIADWTLTRRS
jgi:geranylgeranyl pyrophosphate synthase